MLQRTWKIWNFALVLVSVPRTSWYSASEGLERPISPIEFAPFSAIQRATWNPYPLIPPATKYVLFSFTPHSSRPRGRTEVFWWSPLSLDGTNEWIRKEMLWNALMEFLNGELSTVKSFVASMAVVMSILINLISCGFFKSGPPFSSSRLSKLSCW